MNSLWPPVAVRYWSCVPCALMIGTNTFFAPGARLSRIITPAFVYGSVLVSDCTRATISPSPFSV